MLFALYRDSFKKMYILFFSTNLKDVISFILPIGNDKLMKNISNLNLINTILFTYLEDSLKIFRNFEDFDQ